MITSLLPKYDLVQIIDVKVKMRDGVSLSTDIFLPKAIGPFPIVLTRTPYGNNDPRRLAMKKWMAERGVGFVFQDCRGRFDSDGTWEPFRTEREDGWDTIDWISKQSFCNGNVGMTGGSYEGYTTWIEAPDSHPSLKAIAPLVPLPDPVINVPYQDGTFFWNMIVWGLMVYGKTNQNISFIDWPRLYNFRPLRKMSKEVGMENDTTWSNWMNHATKDAWWKKVCYMDKWNKCDIPIFHICGWYDDDGISTYKNFPGMRKNAKTDTAKDSQKLLIGPWPHKLNQSTSCGEVDFGPSSLIDLNTQLLTFFAKHLANETLESNSKFLNSNKRCNIFIMGENKWYTFNDWPIPEAKKTKLYINSSMGANSVSGDGTLTYSPPTQIGGKDSYKYDPKNPVPYVTDPVSLQLGEACDQQSIESRQDVLVYSTNELLSDITICGRVFLHLNIKSTAPGTDFTGKLVDVHPNGKAIQICDGVKRAEFRNSLEKPEWLNPDEIYDLVVDMWATGIKFKKGHRIRLEISSSACPKFYPHTNTKEFQADAVESEIATQTIFHEPGKESYLSVEIIPESSLEN
ncbi:MAG: CocE/NonD family hydrolase [Caldisericia bacterium]|nr:CocE/NonD family hydrolase [Caldisericia bacterium]